MKRKSLLIVLLGTLLWAGNGWAQPLDQTPSGHNPLRKLSRGVANLLFGVVEVPNQWSKAQSTHGGAAALTYGVPKGIVRFIGRELVGVYEILTFPLAVPKGYKPVMRPEWPNEDIEP